MGAQELASAVAYYSYGGYYGNGPSLLLVTAAVLVFSIVAFVYFSLRVQRKRALRRRWAEGRGLAFHRSDESLGEATGRVYSLMGGSHVARMEIVGDVAYLAFEAYNVNDSFGCAELMREWTAQVPPSLFGGAWTY